YLPDLGMVADVINGAGERLPGQHRWALAHNFPAKAKAAVDRAKQNRLQQNAIGVAMHNTGDRRPALVADRVRLILGCGDKLRRARHELRRDWIGRVRRIDQCCDIRGQSNDKFLGYPADLFETAGLDQTRGNKFVTIKDHAGPTNSMTGFTPANPAV